MSFGLVNAFGSLRIAEGKLLNASVTSCLQISAREKTRINRPKLRFPTWFVRKTRILHDDMVTPENRDFVKEVVADKFGPPVVVDGVTLSKYYSPIKGEMITAKEWNPKLWRTGVIAKKIGCYPMWLKDGKKILTTLLQVLDNQVVKYTPPDEYETPRKRPIAVKRKKGCLLLGAESTDPSLLTREYCGLFKDSGVVPKRFLARFFVSPEAALPPGTPLSAMHYKVGDIVDVRGKTVDRGFQGVMKRWGFKGMPASHGVTKTHRRPGNIGSGGQKARVWPGTKMPGHMGNRYRVAKGLKIWRINTKYNVLWVQGLGVPGETNTICYIYDTILPQKKPKEAPCFPTYIATANEELPENIYDEKVHRFGDPTISFTEN